MTKPQTHTAMRYRRLFGKGWQAKFAACLGVAPGTVSKQVTGSVEPAHWFAAYIEFFEITPRDQWPARWAALREAAERMRPLVAENGGEA